MRNTNYKSKAMYNKIPDKAPVDPDNTKHQLGSGYFIPTSMPRAAFTSLLQTWEDKLVQSGFKDIEYRDKDGKVLTFFKDYSSAGSFAKIYNQQTEVYYQYAREFYQTFNWYKHFSQRDAKIHRLIFYFFSEGVSYRKILAILRGAQPLSVCQYPYRVPPSILGKYSVFFVHSRNSKSLQFFAEWLNDKMSSSNVDSAD